MFTQLASLCILECSCTINSISCSQSTLLQNTVFTTTHVTVVWCLCLKYLFPVYVSNFCWCSVTLWEPAMFNSVLVLYLRTHSILKRKNVKELQQSFRELLLFCNKLCALSYITVQLTIKTIPFKSKCSILVEWKNYCLHFVLQHAYIPLTIFQSCSSVHFQASFQKAFQALFEVLLQTWKPDLRLSNCLQ